MGPLCDINNAKTLAALKQLKIFTEWFYKLKGCWIFSGVVTGTVLHEYWSCLVVFHLGYQPIIYMWIWNKNFKYCARLSGKETLDRGVCVFSELNVWKLSCYLYFSMPSHSNRETLH